MKKRLFSMALLVAMLFSLNVSASAYVADSDVALLSDGTESYETVALDQNAFMVLDSVNLSNADVQPFDESFGLTMPVAETESRTTPSLADIGSNPCNSYTVTLGTDQAHFLVFTSSSKRVMFSKFTSGNSEYAFALCKITSDGSIQQATDFYTSGSHINAVLDAGQYAFAILNSGTTYGNSYTVHVNSSTPGANVTNASIHDVNSYYSHIVTLVAMNNSTYIYVDGQEVTDVNDTSNLDWERELNLSWSGGYNYNKHEIYSVNIRDVSLPIVYTSDYASSNNAVIIYLGTGTGYMYNESKRNTTTGAHIFHFLDPLGNETPRKLTSNDIDNYRCWLIFDLDTGKSIDFCSPLNWYYATGTEEASYAFK